jgi:hypothetical protein
MTTTPGSTLPAPTEFAGNRQLGTLDLIASVILTLIGASFVLYLIAQSASFPPFGGLLVALSVFSWIGGTATFIVFTVRKLVSFYWPVVGIALMFAFFYLLVFVATVVR